MSMPSKNKKKQHYTLKLLCLRALIIVPLMNVYHQSFKSVYFCLWHDFMDFVNAIGVCVCTTYTLQEHALKDRDMEMEMKITFE